MSLQKPSNGNIGISDCCQSDQTSVSSIHWVLCCQGLKSSQAWGGNAVKGRRHEVLVLATFLLPHSSWKLTLLGRLQSSRSTLPIDPGMRTQASPPTWRFPGDAQPLRSGLRYVGRHELLQIERECKAIIISLYRRNLAEHGCVYRLFPPADEMKAIQSGEDLLVGIDVLGFGWVG